MGKKKNVIQANETPEDQALVLMQLGYELKNVLNEKVSDSEYDPNVHLARRYKEVKTELATIVAEEKVKVEEVPGKSSKSIRLGGLKFTSRLQEGRATLDKNLLIQNLLAEGMAINVVNGCIERATKTEVPYWVNEIESDK